MCRRKKWKETFPFGHSGPPQAFGYRVSTTGKLESPFRETVTNPPKTYVKTFLAPHFQTFFLYLLPRLLFLLLLLYMYEG